VSLIGNERVKLLANSLDRASTACLAVGVFGPVVSGGTINTVGSVLWLLAAGALPLGAQYVLGRLK